MSPHYLPLLNGLLTPTIKIILMVDSLTHRPRLPILTHIPFKPFPAILNFIRQPKPSLMKEIFVVWPLKITGPLHISGHPFRAFIQDLQPNWRHWGHSMTHILCRNMGIIWSSIQTHTLNIPLDLIFTGMLLRHPSMLDIL